MKKKTRFSKPVKKQTLAEQVAETIRESILADEWEPGTALPTEPELSEEFGVSRAVIRDATRMLAAQGLVEVHHGRGVFVTQSQVEAFGDALLLALRRTGATAWDVEQFEQLIIPEVCALAAIEATDDELAMMQQAADDYMALYGEVLTTYWLEEGWPPKESQKTIIAFRYFIQTVFEATHNQVFSLLAQPLLRLRSMRNWQPPKDDSPTPAQLIQSEQNYLQQIVEAINTRDPAQARQTVKELMQLPAEAKQAMQRTAVGEVSIIHVSSPRGFVLEPPTSQG